METGLVGMAQVVVRNAVLGLLCTAALLVAAGAAGGVGLILGWRGSGWAPAWGRASRVLGAVGGLVFVAALAVLIVWAYLSLGHLPGPGGEAAPS